MSVVISDVTKRYVKTIQLLIKNRRCKSMREFSQKCEILPQSLSSVKMLRRNVTIDMLEKMCEIYDINADSLIVSKGNVRENKVIHQVEFDEIDNLLPYLKNSSKNRAHDCLKFIESCIGSEPKIIEKKHIVAQVEYPSDLVAIQKIRTNPNKNNQTGLLGVYKASKNRYRSQIRVNGRVLRLGFFATPEDAHDAYLLAQQKLSKNKNNVS